MGLIQDKVQSAKSPQEAMLWIAAGIDQILEQLAAKPQAPADPWGEWTHEPSVMDSYTLQEHKDSYVKPDHAVQIMHDDETGATDVAIEPVDEARQAYRRVFAEQRLKLPLALGNNDEDWIELYVKGGPMWLYLGNQDLFMSYPHEVRAEMVADIEQDDVELAHKVSRHVLKFDSDENGGPVKMLIADEFKDKK